MDIKKYENFHLEEIINLYQSVGWTNYLERINIRKPLILMIWGRKRRFAPTKRRKTAVRVTESGFPGVSFFLLAFFPYKQERAAFLQSP
ncbi:MAG: hypothetical protein IKQ04_07710 [Oscillospiraceae bacterium]|nr:hypothetical protein [Oscillospiraceae bacterium]